MTDRIRSATVVFDHDIRIDDAEAILDALRMVRGVASVHPGEPIGGQAWLARETAFQGIREVWFDLLQAMYEPAIWEQIKEVAKKVRN
jgi:hypothetical protein